MMARFGGSRRLQVDESTNWTAGGEHPFTIIHTENTARVRYYEPRGPDTHGTPVVVVYALINSPDILDLRRNRSVIGHFLDRKFDVYVIEWSQPSDLDVYLSLDDYVGRYLYNCIEVVRTRSRSDTVHLVGISTGSPMAAMYAARNPSRVAALVLQGPPIDVGDVGHMVAPGHAGRVVETFGNVPAEVIHLWFACHNPVEYVVRRPLTLLTRIGDPGYLDRIVRLASWVRNGPDIPGELYRQWVEELLEGNALAENRLFIRGSRVELTRIDMPTALILGEFDPFVPLSASLPVLEHVSSDDTAVFILPTGHVGTLADRIAHEEGWPQVCAWLEKRTP